MRFEMTNEAQIAVRGFSAAQVVFFVCDSRRKTARVVEAHISKDLADRHARMMKGCVRVGRVATAEIMGGAYAETF